MQLLVIILEVIIVSSFFYYFLKSCKKRMFLEAILIASTYPTVSSMIGQESNKSLIMFGLYALVVLASIGIEHRQRSSNLPDKRKAYFIYSVVLFMFYFTLNALASPAAGHDYYNQKVILGMIQLIVPSFMIIWFVSYSHINPKYLFKYYERIALFAALLILVHGYILGINSILNGVFMKRVALGESNVIWTGRFISIGFVIVVLSDNKLAVKMFKLIVFMLAMILTGSKAVLVFPVVALIAYTLIFNKSYERFFRLKSIVILSIVVAGFMYILSLLNPMAVQSRYSLNSHTIVLRQESIGKVFNNYVESGGYIIGNGLATSGYPIVKNYDLVSYPHNITIEVLYEAGVLGVILYYLPLLIPFLFLVKEGRFKSSGSEIYISIVILFMYLLYAQTSGNMNGNSFMFVFSGYLIGHRQMTTAA